MINFIVGILVMVCMLFGALVLYLLARRLKLDIDVRRAWLAEYEKDLKEGRGERFEKLQKVLDSSLVLTSDGDGDDASGGDGE